MAERGNLGRIVGWAVFLAWAVVFLAGALGELFEIEPLRRFADVKRIFLR